MYVYDAERNEFYGWEGSSIIDRYENADEREQELLEQLYPWLLGDDEEE